MRSNQRQNNKCVFCGLAFRPTDLVEIDHIKLRSEGGDNTYKNKPSVAPTLPRYLKTALDNKTYPKPKL